jgi:hypothetical protein
MLHAANPFAPGIGTPNWNGHAYELRGFYEQGAQNEGYDEEWVLPEQAEEAVIPRSREYRHLLSTILNGALDLGFVFFQLDEDSVQPTPDLTPGSWSHLMATIPPWLWFWFRLDPEA